jgi:hypothetical protein
LYALTKMHTAYRDKQNIEELVGLLQEECDKFPCQASLLFKGRLFLHDRDRASAEVFFKKGLNHKPDYVGSVYPAPFAGSDKMLCAVSAEAAPQPLSSDAVFLGEPQLNNGNTVILVSCDVKYFEMFGILILGQLLTIGKHNRYHFHIIGGSGKAESAIDAFLKCHEQALRFRDGARYTIPPTFSAESVPKEVKDKRTYYACARYLRLGEFLRRFGNDVLVLDADVTWRQYPLYVFRRITAAGADVVLARKFGFNHLSPSMTDFAGFVYVSNNERSLRFASVLRDYILTHIQKQDIWGLDQTALQYACDSCAEAMTIRPTGDFQVQVAQEAFRVEVKQY